MKVIFDTEDESLVINDQKFVRNFDVRCSSCYFHTEDDGDEPNDASNIACALCDRCIAGVGGWLDPNVTVLSKQEIADKFNIKVSQLVISD